jgi:hypothetical protein
MKKTPLEASTPKKHKPSPSIVMPTKKVKMDKLKKKCKIEAPENSVIVVVVIVTVVVVIVIAVIVAVVVALAIACDNGTVLVESLYPKEKEGQQCYYATRIVG